MESHSGPFWYYVPVILVLTLPFSFILVRALFSVKTYIREPLTRYLLIWFGIVFIFFSISSTKLPHYLLYGSTPLFVLMARCLVSLKDKKWLYMAPVLILPSLLLVVLVMVGTETVRTDHPYGHEILEHAQQALAGMNQVWLIAGLILAVTLMIYPGRDVWRRMIGAGVLQSLIISLVVLPTAGELLQKPVQEAAIIAVSTGRPVVTGTRLMPSFSVYRRAVTPFRPPRPGEVVFLRVDDLKNIERSYEILYSKGGVMLVLVSPGQRLEGTR